MACPRGRDRSVARVGALSPTSTAGKRSRSTFRQGSKPLCHDGILKWPPFALVSVAHRPRFHPGRRYVFTVMRATLDRGGGRGHVVLYFLMTRCVPAREVRRISSSASASIRSRLSSSCSTSIDVFVGLFVMLGLWALVSGDRGRDAVGWLAASLSFGFGVFVETVPLALLPLLAPGMRRASRLGAVCSLALFFGPVGSPSLSLSCPGRTPSSTTSSLRSISGYFGITVFSALRTSRASPRVRRRLHGFARRRVCSCSSACSGRGLDVRRTILLAGLVLAAIPVLGPGYAPAYAYGSCRRSSRVVPCSTIDGGGSPGLLRRRRRAFIVEDGLIDGSATSSTGSSVTRAPPPAQRSDLDAGRRDGRAAAALCCALVVLVAGFVGCGRPTVRAWKSARSMSAGCAGGCGTSLSCSAARGSSERSSSPHGRVQPTPTTSTAGCRSRSSSKAERTRTSRRRSSSGRRSR